MRAYRIGIFTILMFILGFVQLEPHANPGKRSVGEDIFRNRCTVCHGLDGSGETTLGNKLGIPDLRANEKQLTDDQMIKIITEGKGGMPAFKKKLSRDGIQEVIGHLKELRKND
jgi:mono/diheme cytochrome c family protein